MDPDPSKRALKRRAADIRAHYEQTKAQYQEALDVWVEHYPQVADRLVSIQGRRLQTALRYRDYLLARLSGGRADRDFEREHDEGDKREMWELLTILASADPSISATSLYAEYCAVIDAGIAQIELRARATVDQMLDYHLEQREGGPDSPAQQDDN